MNQLQRIHTPAVQSNASPANSLACPTSGAGVRTSNVTPAPPVEQQQTLNIQVPLVAVPNLDEYCNLYLKKQPDIKSIEQRVFETGDLYLLVEYHDGSHKAFKGNSGNITASTSKAIKPRTSRGRKSGTRGAARGTNNKRSKMQLEQNKMDTVNTALQNNSGGVPAPKIACTQGTSPFTNTYDGVHLTTSQSTQPTIAGLNSSVGINSLRDGDNYF